MILTSRASWGARHEAGDGPAPLPASEVWLHHSVTIAPDLVEPFDDEHAAMRQLEAIGEQRFGRGISYTFAVMPSGRVYEGHGVATRGAHTAGRNSISRAIVLVGNYDTARPTPTQIDGAAQLLVDGWRRGWWTAPRLNGGHQNAPGAATACPGRHGMAAVSAINTRAAAIAGAPTEGDDMSVTDADAKKIAGAVWGHILKAAGGPNGPIGPAGAGDFLRHAAAAATAAAKDDGPAVVDVDEEAIADALAPQLGAFLQSSVARLSTADLMAIATTVIGEQGRRLAALPAPAAPVRFAALDVEPGAIAYDVPEPRADVEPEPEPEPFLPEPEQPAARVPFLLRN